jgi:putative transcriptional regulator
MAKAKKRNVFGELMEGVRAMRAYREGRITLRSHRVPALSLPAVDERVIRTTRERLHMSRAAFAHRLGVNPCTLERWEQGRSAPNDEAARPHPARSKIPGHTQSAPSPSGRRIGWRFL